MKEFGKVSIIMPSWNCGRFVEAAILSVQAQTYQDWELLFQDDASTDETCELVLKMSAEDPRIKYECNQGNLGAAVTRNNALRRATGRWIAFLDSDDLWNPEKLEQQLKFMVVNSYSFTYHEYSEMTEEGVKTGTYVSGKARVGVFDMYSCCWPGCLSVMYDREKIGLIQINDIRKNNDTAMWLKVIKKSPCHILKRDLATYRRRKGSITPPTLMQKIWAHYPLFRVGAEMNPICATFWTIANVFGNAYKKLFFVSIVK